MVLLVGAIAVLLLVLGAQRVDKYRDIRDWPVVRGVVVASSMTERARATLESYQAPAKIDAVGNVEFRYSVAGAEYEGSSLSLESMTNQPGLKMKLRKAYPAGTEVEVHYDPGYPEESYLEVRAGFSTWSLLGWGVLLGAFFFYILWKGYVEPAIRER
ncbi:MAG: hypothetical protein CVV47_12815 [Spirochaetae bacterium HGW-Spirochaetae-3]|jgi:hypothetical protein|nr:MAG: hypothetical protein CVV47_12815 [Spirochaetae bacterium HGW-Spirochaetae-3]